MADNGNYRKEAETQATTDPAPEEFDSNIAPQGYEPQLVQEIADLETPPQKRRKAIRYLIWAALLLLIATYFCTPRNVERPNDIPIPYGLENRPLPSSDLFLYQIAPQSLGNFKLVHQQVERSYEKPFVGAEIATATYTNPQGRAVTVWVIDAGSYINANRYLRGLRTLLQETAGTGQVADRIWLDHSFLAWEAPELANRTYGFAWNNDRFYYSVTGANKEDRDFFVENFPY